MALATIKRILRASHVTVIGSASLSQREHELIRLSDRLICVNGSISSIERVPDVWVLNSREYDTKPYVTFSDERKRLHEAMMVQSINKASRHILYLLKNGRPDQTIARLKQNGVKWWGQTILSTREKTNLVCKAGVKRFSTAFNTSAGLFGLCLALTSDAAHVNLCGFGFDNDYAYLSEVPPDTRKHIPQDLEALSDLIAIHPHRFSLTAGIFMPVQHTGVL